MNAGNVHNAYLYTSLFSPSSLFQTYQADLIEYNAEREFVPSVFTYTLC